MPIEISQELTTKILDDLADVHDVDDIVMEVCEKTGLTWEEVEAYVHRLAAENENKIALAQSPLLTLLALVTFGTGIAIILSSVGQVVQIYLANSHALIIYFASNGGGFLGSLLLGIAMIVGSLKGMQNVWEAIFEKLGIIK